MAIQLVVNGIEVALLKNLTARYSDAPWNRKEVLTWLDNKEYILPPDTIIEQDPDSQRIVASCQLEREKAFDYVGAGYLPKCVLTAFEPAFKEKTSGQLADLFFEETVKLQALSPPPPLIMSKKQALALGFMTQEEYDKVDMSFPKLEPLPVYETGIEASYDFGILSEEQSVAVARNVNIPQELELPGRTEESLGLADLFKESIKKLIEEKVQDTELSLAVDLLDVTLDPVEVREV